MESIPEKKMKKRLLFFLLFTLSCNVFSQSDAAILDKLIRDDSSSITLFFSYPDSIRSAIFLASTYPQGFVRLDEIQKSTSGSFQKIISKYDKNKQQQFYDISRYPELISLLIKNRNKPENEIDPLLKGYPQKIQLAAKELRKHHHETLVEIEQLHSLFQTKYMEVVNSFPASVKSAFNILLKTPEVVSALSDEIKATVTLGDVYKRNPMLLKQKADSLSLEIAKQKVLDFQDWTKTMNNDTINSNLKKIAAEYAKEHNDDIENTNEPGNIYVIHDLNPYPYWFGYPYWYAGPFWYPYPWWYHCGYYWNSYGTIVFVSMPTYYFGWWYFNNPHHHYYYPQTSNLFYNHYYGHRKSFYGFNNSVREWERKNINSFPENWRKNDGQHAERFREYGKSNLNQQINRKRISPEPAIKNKSSDRKAPVKSPEVKPSDRPVPKAVPAPRSIPEPIEKPAPAKKTVPPVVEKSVPDVKPVQPPAKKAPFRQTPRQKNIPKKTGEK